MQPKLNHQNDWPRTIIYVTICDPYYFFHKQSFDQPDAKDWPRCRTSTLPGGSFSQSAFKRQRYSKPHQLGQRSTWRLASHDDQYLKIIVTILKMAIIVKRVIRTIIMIILMMFFQQLLLYVIIICYYSYYIIYLILI